NINYQQLASIPIVVPAKGIQRKIIDLWNAAQGLEKIKRQQAKEKLTSIDTYLLDKLEILLPVKRETLGDRVFIVSSQKITGKRLDPNAYKVQVQNLKKTVVNSSFPKKVLKQLVSKGSGGSWGTDIV